MGILVTTLDCQEVQTSSTMPKLGVLLPEPGTGPCAQKHHSRAGWRQGPHCSAAREALKDVRPRGHWGILSVE